MPGGKAACRAAGRSIWGKMKAGADFAANCSGMGGRPLGLGGIIRSALKLASFRPKPMNTTHPSPPFSQRWKLPLPAAAVRRGKEQDHCCKPDCVDGGVQRHQQKGGGGRRPRLR